jgi:hypothetical protein
MFLILSTELKQAVHRCYAWALLPAVSYVLGIGENIEKENEMGIYI